MKIVGVDPGLDGGVALLNGDGALAMAMPVIKLEKGRELDLTILMTTLAGADYVFVERVHAMPKQGVVSTFTFGMGFGQLLGVLAAMRLPHTLVTPQQWQRVMLHGRGHGKGDSLVTAAQLFPSIAPRLTATKHGLADALLIAEYGRRLMAGQATPNA